MNAETTLFDYYEGKRLMEEGLLKVSSYPNDSWVHRARNIAIGIAHKKGTVTINDVYKEIERPAEMHPNVAGAVMRCKELRYSETIRSEKTSRRTGKIGVYVLSDFQA